MSSSSTKQVVNAFIGTAVPRGQVAGGGTGGGSPGATGATGPTGPVGPGGSTGGVLPSAPTGPGYYLLSISSSGVADWVVATQDEIGAGFSVSLSLASGGDGPFEVGATWTPTFNASPATNSVTVNNCSISDSLGNTTSGLDQSNPIAAPIAGGTYTIDTSRSVSVTVKETLISTGTTANSNSVSASWLTRIGAGVDSSNTGTSATSSGNNFQINDGAVIPGYLESVGVGSVLPGVSPANQHAVFLLNHTTQAHTFVANGFAFLMTRVASNINVPNQLGVVVAMDLYYSQSLLNAAFSVVIAS